MSTINVFGINNFDKFREYCLLCGSLNYYYCRGNSDYDAICCWNCRSAFWLDDMSETIYCMLNNKTPEEANEDLREFNFPLRVLDGQMCEDLE